MWNKAALVSTTKTQSHKVYKTLHWRRSWGRNERWPGKNYSSKCTHQWHPFLHPFPSPPPLPSPSLLLCRYPKEVQRLLPLIAEHFSPFLLSLGAGLHESMMVAVAVWGLVEVDFFLGSSQIIFPKGKSALQKTNFCTSNRLIFCQPHYDDCNVISGILERIATPTYINLHQQPSSWNIETATWGKEENSKYSLVGKTCTPKVLLLKHE